MGEGKMVDLVQRTLDKGGVDDRVVAVGQFNPRGHTGGLFVGGLAGRSVPGVLGGVGTAAGSLAGMRVADAASGLPAKMLVGVSATTVYGFDAATRHSEPTAVVFALP